MKAIRPFYLAALLGVLATSCTSVSPHKPAPSDKQDLQIVPARAIGEEIILIGDLGVPLGTTVTITGSFSDSGFNQFKVTSVNGRTHTSTVFLDYDNKWHDGTTMTIQGYEYGTISLVEHLPNGLYIGAPQLKNQGVHILFHVLKAVTSSGESFMRQY